jgi:tetratricopeptide (TPR) repeat protein
MEFKHQGNDFFVDEMYSEAIASYTKCLESISSDADGFAKRAAAYLKLNKFKEAVQDASKALELNPTLSFAYLRKGYVCLSILSCWFFIDSNHLSQNIELVILKWSNMQMQRKLSREDVKFFLRTKSKSKFLRNFKHGFVNAMLN